jgi:hypothetical protein
MRKVTWIGLLLFGGILLGAFAKNLKMSDIRSILFGLGSISLVSYLVYRRELRNERRKNADLSQHTRTLRVHKNEWFQ